MRQSCLLPAKPQAIDAYKKTAAKYPEHVPPNFLETATTQLLECTAIVSEASVLAVFAKAKQLGSRQMDVQMLQEQVRLMHKLHVSESQVHPAIMASIKQSIRSKSGKLA